jgi:hypothetical protein
MQHKLKPQSTERAKMKQNSDPISRRTFVRVTGTIALGALIVPAYAEDPSVTVHKGPNCGCCSRWAKHLQNAGFTVRVEETSDLDTVRERLGVPAELDACHTAEVGPYLLQGHVPAVAVRRLLAERPNVKGLAVPGMPVGSPGMEGGKPEPYTVLSFGADGIRPFMRFVGDQVVD